MKLLIDKNLPKAHELFMSANAEAAGAFVSVSAEAAGAFVSASAEAAGAFVSASAEAAGANASEHELVFYSDRQPPAAELADCDVLLIRSVTKVDAELLAQAPNLKFVGTATIGTDHVDQPLLAEKGIRFVSAPGCNAIAVGEYILAAVLAVLFKGNQAALAINNNATDCVANSLSSVNLNAVVIGAGHTGTQVCQRLLALGMTVHVIDPPRQAAGLPAPEGTDYVDWTALAQADLVSCHVPLTREGEHATYHLFTAAELERLKSTVIFCNASRGPVVNAADLLAWRRKRPDVKLVLDVWEHEPAVNPDLVAVTEIATPHIAGHSIEGKIRGTYQLYQQWCEWQGVEPKMALHDVLPSELVFTDVAANAEISLAQIADWVAAVYAVRDDDQAFRQQGMTPAGFDQLRKNYRYRRELSAARLRKESDEAGDAISSRLQALGFQVEVERT